MNFIEAETSSIIKKANNRIVSPCPYFDSCGGCDLLHLNYEDSLKFKQDKITYKGKINLKDPEARLCLVCEGKAKRPEWLKWRKQEGYQERAQKERGHTGRVL